MYSELESKADWLIKALPATVLQGRRIGIEKESLRVTQTGEISQADHPAALGSALTHSCITTDFSEALLELVTPPLESAPQALSYLSDIHHYVVNRLPAGEHLWHTSMPCVLRGDSSIRVGEYGSSLNGRMKHIYRQGLALRYGKRMQAIAGIHFNFSFPDVYWELLDRHALKSASGTTTETLQSDWDSRDNRQKIGLRSRGYFAMTQNLLRIGWIIPYLFGASPAICRSFLDDEGEAEGLAGWNTHTRFAQHGTSLRMGRFGYRYREDKPIDLNVRHTCLEDYISDIIGHVRTPHPPYQALGIRDASGLRQQLSVNRLQIENEYYSSVRPKQIPKAGELPIHALTTRGIRYLELRSIDVNIFEPAGLGIHDVLMLELLMLFASLDTVSPLSDEERAIATRNVQTVAHRGREPDLQLEGPDGAVSLRNWGASIIQLLRPVASWLDQHVNARAGNQANPDVTYEAALDRQLSRIENPDLTPSARMIEGIKEAGSFFEFARSQSLQHHKVFAAQTGDAEFIHSLDLERDQSINRQRDLENAAQGELESFLSAYLGQINESPVFEN